jgi:CubicO group peptidase (beta-lactamase class C family)
MRVGAGLTDVDDLLRRAIQTGLGVGWVGLATRGPEVGLCWTAGRAAVGGGEVEASLWYDLASLTKPLATTTLLLLARRDGLDLDAPMAELLPELRGGPWERVTVLQCATHTAGLPAWEPLYVAGCSRPAYLDRINGLRPNAEPGARVEYSCLGFILLGLALERAADSDLASLFRELVVGPLGLADSLAFAPATGSVDAAAAERAWFVERRLLAERGLVAEPPAAVAGVVVCGDGNARGLGGAAGNAGLLGCAAGVAQLAAEYLPGGGELITAEEASFATRCLTEGREQARGIGWQLAPTPGCSAGRGLSASAFGHTGFSGTSVWADPETAAVCVLLGNRLHPGGRTPDLAPLRRRFNLLACRSLLDNQRVAGRSWL